MWLVFWHEPNHLLSELEPLRRDLLVIHDSTELDYSSHRSLTGLGQIGNRKHRGYICHNSLVVDPCSRHVMGLMKQVLHRRPKVRKNETHKQLRERVAFG